MIRAVVHGGGLRAIIPAAGTRVQVAAPLGMKATVYVGGRGGNGPAGPSGPAGPPGPAGATYLHAQPFASADWIVNHNLGVRPSATVLSPGGVEVEAGVVHVSTNQLRVIFHTPQSGSCRCV